MPHPRPPEGLRLIDPNGKEWPCAVDFLRTDENGMHHWQATPIGLTRKAAKMLTGPRGIAGWQIKMDVLPGHTSVEWKAPT
jgi:hypothetical protein